MDPTESTEGRSGYSSIYSTVVEYPGAGAGGMVGLNLVEYPDIIPCMVYCCTRVYSCTQLS